MIEIKVKENKGMSTEMEIVSKLMEKYTKDCVTELAKKYNFKLNEALKYLNIEKREEKKEIEKIQILIPFCGEIKEEWCNGVRLNYGLYTQCTNNKDNKSGFCKTCVKQGEKNGTGIPTYGTIQERAKLGNDFRDPKGKAPVRYANIMDKFKISLENAISEANKLGWTIPDEELEVKIVKRGRPKKGVSVSDTESEASAPIEKKRGRPRKDKTLVSELATGDDLIAGLIKEAKKDEENAIIERPKEKIEPEITTDVVESDNEETEEIDVTMFTDPTTGIEYYKTEENILYNMDSEPVGRWNSKTNKIESLDLELDDE